MCCMVVPKPMVRGNLEVCAKVTCTFKYLQTMNGTAVARIVVLRPIVSIKGPPAIPPNRADSGIRLPIHDFWNRQMYRWRQYSEPCSRTSRTPASSVGRSRVWILTHKPNRLDWSLSLFASVSPSWFPNYIRGTFPLPSTSLPLITLSLYVV
jgi:hypothetical protein